jgi:hypothetical protein
VTITKPSAGDTPWTTTGDALVDTVNAMQDFYLEAYYDDTSTGTSVTYATWTKLPVDTEVSDTGSDFDNSTYIYTVPVTGRYMCFAVVRIKDNDQAVTAGINFAVGIHTSEIDGTWVKWDIVPDTATGGHPGRFVMDYKRIGTFTASDQLRLYCFHEEPTDLVIWRTRLVIWRIS